MRNATTTRAAEAATHAREDALKIFFAIAEEWGLTSDQQIVLLGSPARSTFFKWKKDGGLISADVMERISHIVAIYKALNILFAAVETANGWIKRPNKYFEGYSALEAMLNGTLADIYKVRTYVDAQRGG